MTLPGPPLQLLEADGTELTRGSHAARRALDEHGDTSGSG